MNAWFAGSMGNPPLTPFRVVATIVQGPPPPQATIWIGMLIHSLLSGIFGLVFAALIASMRRRTSHGALLWAGLIYAGLIYIVDFQVLARFIHQFSALRATNQPLELAAHLVFGAVLVALLALWAPRTRGRRAE
ncbi:hypothetical protein SAMN05661080_02144 [Modestobacter sp. DSM 44400]|uniref:hypothetical protein n=1 Tax=Modestobacter sp. DSM 44400 TaxID=1550230 RepID=UPI000899E993|nr:hypothetical protein [Modestobacter sp. DSM 44400]SDY05117.1 hypothetical protein SAMN05661080_02144 [Modestobacter sp. DSM 44400]